jgi:mycothiol synthase
MLTYRPAVDLADLRLADDLMSAAWSSGSPTCVGTPAAIEWWYAGSWPDVLADHLRLWFMDGEPVAWTWHDSGELEWHVWSGDPERDRVVAREALATVVTEAAGSLVGAWAADDDHVALALFEALGFRRAGRRLSQWQRHAEEGALAADAIPDGYTIRSVLGPDEVPARVDVHRKAFTGSRLNVEKYERLSTLPHYRYEDDLVVEAPDGSLAAFAMAWWDPVARVGEFEPVGTAAGHQRLGLARSLLTHGLARYFAMGARIVQVYADADDPGPEALYETVGFHRRAFHHRFEHGAAAATTSAPGATDLQSTP